MKNPSPCWCPVPWTSVSMNNNGDYRLCVQANTHRETRGIFNDHAGRPLNAAKTRIAEARNALLVKEVRASMLQGKPHPVCERCHQEDRLKTKSRRSLEREKFLGSGQYEELISSTRPDGEIDTRRLPVKDIDLRLGNHCNLSCRSCYPGESSGWYEEWKATRWHKFSLPNKSEVHLKTTPAGKVFAQNEQSLKWYEESSFFGHFIDDSAGVTHIHIVGGEPLLIGKHFKLLERLIEEGRAPHIVLDYNSNLTILHRRAIELWSHFKEIRIGVSIDGPPRVNDFIRHPSKIEIVSENIKTLRRELSNLKIWITSTVMIYNVLYLPEMIDYVVNENLLDLKKPGDMKQITFHQLHNPLYLNVSILPLPLKEKIRARYDQWLVDKNLGAEWRHAYSNLLNFPASMLQGKENLSELKTFVFKNRLMDEFRGQSFSKSLPEIASLLESSVPLEDALI